MALYGVETVLTYVAWDTQTNAGKVDDAANHTLYWVKDGTANAATNAPSQVDATNAPGLYKVTITSTEAQCIFGTLCGKSATANVSIVPVSLAFERLPNAAIGGEGGLPVLDANGNIAVDVARISGDADAADNLEAAFEVAAGATGGVAIVGSNMGTVTGVTGNVSGSVGSVTGAVGSVTGAVGSVSGDVAGKVIGGGSGTITGIGAWALGSAGAALATAATFTGITTLANWLRAIIRSDTADSTALSEINATGGTYDETTDSLQGIATTQVEELAAIAEAQGVLDKVDTTLELSGSAYRFTAGALAQAPTGDAPTAEEIAEAVDTELSDDFDIVTQGLNAIADTALSNNVWTDARAAYLDELAAANIPADLAVIIGLAGENQYIDTIVEDSLGRMTSGRLRIYSDGESVGTDDDVIATYTITCTYTGASTTPTTYEMVRE